MTLRIALQARATGDAILLVISKLDYEELVHSYPEQNDIIVTNILGMFGLDKDGNNVTAPGKEGQSVTEDAKEKLRWGSPHWILLIVAHSCCSCLYTFVLFRSPLLQGHL